MISARISDEGRCLLGMPRRTLAKISLYYLMIIFHVKILFHDIAKILACPKYGTDHFIPAYSQNICIASL